MNEKFKNVRAVGFDLDGTLYPATHEMDERIRDQAAIKILEKKPEIGSVEGAGKFYEEKYEELESGSRTLMAIGYEKWEAIAAMKEILEKAYISDLISEDKELVEILEKIKDKYYSYLITKSPRELAKGKLRKIGIRDDHFDAEFFGDDLLLAAKQKSVALKEISESASIPLTQHVYVGDRVKADIIEPKSLGMKTIAVWSDIPEADVSIPHIHELRKVLLGD